MAISAIVEVQEFSGGGELNLRARRARKLWRLIPKIEARRCWMSEGPQSQNNEPGVVTGETN
jgi:hypothetical protein